MNSDVITTRSSDIFSKLKSWSQTNSIWSLSLGNGCCFLEYISSRSSNLNNNLVNNFYPPKQSDLLIISGIVTKKSLPIILQKYNEMEWPKWVISIGACAISGGAYDGSNIVKNLNEHLPIDIEVQGCPPRPDQIAESISRLLKMIKTKEKSHD